MKSDKNGIDSQVWRCCMPSLALDRDAEDIHRRLDSARPDRKLAYVHSRPAVQTIHARDVEPVHEAVSDHLATTAPTFLGWLEDDNGAAAEIAGLAQMAGSTKEHCGVPVMATGMHAARYRRGVREPCLFADRQRIHIGSEADGRASPSMAAYNPDDTCAPEAGHHIVTPELPEFMFNECRRLLRVEQKFRMLVEMMSPLHDFGLHFDGAAKQRHGSFPPKGHVTSSNCIRRKQSGFSIGWPCDRRS